MLSLGIVPGVNLAAFVVDRGFSGRALTRIRLSRASTVGVLMAVAVVSSGCGGSDVAESTSTTKVLPNVTTTAATVLPTTIPTTTVPATVPETTATPTTTNVEDALDSAIDRAQTAMRNCYEVAPGCDQAELEGALVGLLLEAFLERSDDGTTYDGADALLWTTLEGPAKRGDELAVATICRFDPMVVTYVDGSVDDEAYYFKQDWYLLPVGDTWKVSEIINLNDATTESSACDA